MREKDLDKRVEVMSQMFDSIADVYDRLNHLLSFGIDRIWRRRLVASVSEAQNVLDLACGTADVTLKLLRKGKTVTGADVSEKMLQLAEDKVRRKMGAGAERVRFVCADAAEMPFEDGEFDAVTIAFGVRNFDRREECLKEIRRVLKDGGMLSVAEFSVPHHNLWRAMYHFYFTKVLPVIGRLLSRQPWAYTYLPESSIAFPRPPVFIQELKDAGFSSITARSMTGGVAYLYVAKVEK